MTPSTPTNFNDTNDTNSDTNDTFWLVAQCLSQPRHCVSPYLYMCISFISETSLTSEALVARMMTFAS
jgi:hypothetical protein